MKVLALLHPGTNSRSIFRDLLDGLERAGHPTTVVDLAPVWEVYDREARQGGQRRQEFTKLLAGMIRASRVELVISLWGTSLFSLMNVVHEGAPGTVFDALGVPNLMVWLDAPHWAHDGAVVPLMGTPILRGPAQRHLVNNAATGAEMREVLGFDRVLELPYAVGETVFRPVPDAGEPDLDVVASLGPGDPPPTPEALAIVRGGRPDMPALRRLEAARVAGELDALAEGRPALRDALRALLDTQLAARHTPLLDRIRGVGCAELLSDPRLFVRAGAVLRSVERLERVATLAHLARRFRVGVFGGGAVRAWCPEAVDLGGVPYESQAGAYARGRVAVSVMRWQDDAGINLKPYEICASGRPCVCSARRGLDAVFEPGREVLAFDAPEGCADAVRALLDDDARRRALAEAGRTRVLREHTWTIRAGQITARATAPSG